MEPTRVTEVGRENLRRAAEPLRWEYRQCSEARRGSRAGLVMAAMGAILVASLALGVAFREGSMPRNREP